MVLGKRVLIQGAVVVRHHSSPFATKRRLYLQQMTDEGRSRKLLRDIAQLLLGIAHHLRLDRSEIPSSRHRSCFCRMGEDTQRSRRCRDVGERLFVYHASGLLRMLGRLRESHAEVAYTARLGAFLHFQSMSGVFRQTLHHYEMCVGELLNWIGREGKPLEEVSLEIYLRILPVVGETQVEADQHRPSRRQAAQLHS